MRHRSSPHPSYVPLTADTLVSGFTVITSGDGVAHTCLLLLLWCCLSSCDLWHVSVYSYCSRCLLISLVSGCSLHCLLGTMSNIARSVAIVFVVIECVHGTFWIHYCFIGCWMDDVISLFKSHDISGLFSQHCPPLNSDRPDQTLDPLIHTGPISLNEPLSFCLASSCAI